MPQKATCERFAVVQNDLDCGHFGGTFDTR